MSRRSSREAEPPRLNRVYYFAKRSFFFFFFWGSTRNWPIRALTIVLVYDTIAYNILWNNLINGTVVHLRADLSYPSTVRERGIAAAAATTTTTCVTARVNDEAENAVNTLPHCRPAVIDSPTLSLARSRVERVNVSEPRIHARTRAHTHSTL